MRFNLLTFISFLSVVLVILLPTASFFFFIPSYESVLTSVIEDESIRVAKHLSEDFIIRGKILDRSRVSPQFESKIKEVVADFNIMKVKLFSNSGEVIYSTAPEEIGTINK